MSTVDMNLVLQWQASMHPFGWFDSSAQRQLLERQSPLREPELVGPCVTDELPDSSFDLEFPMNFFGCRSGLRALARAA